jgi:hypothetical protein
LDEQLGWSNVGRIVEDVAMIGIMSCGRLHRKCGNLYSKYKGDHDGKPMSPYQVWAMVVLLVRYEPALDMAMYAQWISLMLSRTFYTIWAISIVDVAPGVGV